MLPSLLAANECDSLLLFYNIASLNKNHHLGVLLIFIFISLLSDFETLMDLYKLSVKVWDHSCLTACHNWQYWGIRKTSAGDTVDLAEDVGASLQQAKSWVDKNLCPQLSNPQ